MSDAGPGAGSSKPLFIPLRTIWFRGFESGEKNTEYRAYGPRWNERTCAIGRLAVLSHGYSGERLQRRVATFAKLPADQAPAEARAIYPDAPFIAAIGLEPRPQGTTADFTEQRRTERPRS